MQNMNSLAIFIYNFRKLKLENQLNHNWLPYLFFNLTSGVLFSSSIPSEMKKNMFLHSNQAMKYFIYSPNIFFRFSFFFFFFAHELQCKTYFFLISIRDYLRWKIWFQIQCECSRDYLWKKVPFLIRDEMEITAAIFYDGNDLKLYRFVGFWNWRKCLIGLTNVQLFY